LARGAIGVFVACAAGHLAAPSAAGARQTSDVAVLRTPGPERVLIRAGTFTMGSEEDEIWAALATCRAEPAGEQCREDFFSHELSAHPVFLNDYWIDR